MNHSSLKRKLLLIRETINLPPSATPLKYKVYGIKYNKEDINNHPKDKEDNNHQKDKEYIGIHPKYIKDTFFTRKVLIKEFDFIIDTEAIYPFQRSNTTYIKFNPVDVIVFTTPLIISFTPYGLACSSLALYTVRRLRWAYRINEESRYALIFFKWAIIIAFLFFYTAYLSCEIETYRF